MKKYITTSKKKYITPIITIEELEKQDILTVSGVDNGEFDMFQFGDSGGPVDLFNELFN